MPLTTFNICGFMLALPAAAFNLYPTINTDNLAKSFGISIDCLDALNETIPCDQTLFQMSNSVDSYLWTIENVTDLCTPTCIESTAKWWSDVQTRCATDNIAAYGKMIPAETIPGRFLEGLSIACLQSGVSSNSSASNSSHAFSNSTSVTTSSAPYSDSSSASNMTSSGPSWCLIESQEWVGSKIIRPDCTTGSTDLSCEDPSNVSPENERIANLSPDDSLCSDCFIKMFYQRLSSPYLPDADYSGYLVSQYQDILDVCKVTMPEPVIRDLPFSGDAPETLNAISSSDLTIDTRPSVYPNGTHHLNGTNSSYTCTGQTIQMNNVSNGFFPSVNISFCDVLSEKYGVTTGDLGALLGNLYCEPSASSYCAPAACSLVRVSSSATCDSISSANGITTLQFRNWNPNVNGLCDNLQESDYVCIGAPGGSYIPPRVIQSSTNATTQKPGGNDTETSNKSTAPYRNSTNPTSTSASQPSGSSRSNPAAPSPTQKDISTSCTKYSQAKHGDYCSTFAKANNIALTQFYALNGVLGNAGELCSSKFWSGYYYCVGSSDMFPLGSSHLSTKTTTMSTVDSARTIAITPVMLTTAVSTVTSTVIATTSATATFTTLSQTVPTTANNAFPCPPLSN